LGGKKIARGVELWVQTNRVVYHWLKEAGLLESLSFSGVKVTTDTCNLNWPRNIWDNWGFRLLVTNSGKWAHYAPGLTGLQVIFGNIQKCVEAALKGEIREG